MVDIIKACQDLGVHVSGAHLGPEKIVNLDFIDRAKNIYTVERVYANKDKDINNKKKNLLPINLFNEKLYKQVRASIQDGSIPITVGGDHSIAIGSALASIKEHNSLGIIWYDAHADYNTFETTITGNIHGVPLATLNGLNGTELTLFHDGNFYSPSNTVIIGGRSIDIPDELDNLSKAGVTIITDEECKKIGIKEAIRKAIIIAANHTKGIHLSLDIDEINPLYAPGVSVPELGGATKEEFYSVTRELMQYNDLIKSIDLVEYNPTLDKNGMTLEIAEETLKIITDSFIDA